MVDVITTFTFEVEHQLDQRTTRVVAEFTQPVVEELRDSLLTRFNGGWSADRRQYEFDLRYTLSAANDAKEAGAEVSFRPKTLTVSLAEVVDEAERRALEKESWPVRAVEILDETVDFTFDDDFAGLVVRATCTARVTQSRE